MGNSGDPSKEKVDEWERKQKWKNYFLKKGKKEASVLYTVSLWLLVPSRP